MKRKTLILLAALLLTSLAGGAAWARGHAHVGVFVGVPFAGPYHYYPRYYYPYPPYYYPAVPVVVTPPAPPVYIEQGQQPQQADGALPSNYWYYCQNPQGYYPYVKECQGGWQQVSPQPPARP